MKTKEKGMNKNMWYLILGSVIVLSMTGCADVEQVTEVVKNNETLQAITLTGHTYGFWGGLWHGMVLPFSFFGQLFSDEIAIWAVNNNGGWYNFGFWLGAAVLAGGSTVTTSSKGK